MPETTWPIAEHFTSTQGEGLYTGTLMTFVRLAGCTVGTVPTPSEKAQFHIQNNYQRTCHVVGERTMGCDTDYQSKWKMTKREILGLVPPGVRRVCITGGEPLMHTNLPELVEFLYKNEKVLHIETSGTIPLTAELAEMLELFDCVAVSPKQGFLDAYIISGIATEIKLLVDEDFAVSKLTPELQNLFTKYKPAFPLTYLQPVNGEHTISKENMDRCLALQKRYPGLRISSQAHKMWNVL